MGALGRGGAGSVEAEKRFVKMSRNFMGGPVGKGLRRPDGPRLSHWRGLGNLRVRPVKFLGCFTGCDGIFDGGEVA